MEIKKIDHKLTYENFLFSCKDKNFLNSWNWGEFQKKLGNKIWRFGIYKNSVLISTALIIKIIAKRGKFLYLPYSPIIRTENQKDKRDILKILLEKNREIAKKEKVDFIRISPIVKQTDENIEIFKNLGFKNAPIYIHPELTWELNLEKTEDEILKQMRKTTRYLIKKNRKDGIKIFESSKIEDIEKFYSIYKQTASRQHFVSFSFDYLKKEFESFISNNEVLLFLAKYKNEIISAAFIIFWQDCAFYHHGASSLKYSNISSAYLLQWEIIKKAKKIGCKRYNFWGIAPVSIINNKVSIIDKNHRWYGLTLFKIGFGGYVKRYLKTQDLILSWNYYLNYLVEKFIRLKRGI